MTNRIFVDSNIWIYAFSEDEDMRGAAARSFIAGAPNENTLVTSYQVVNEVTRILKKQGYSEPDIRRTIAGMFDICEFCNFSQSGAMLASELRETLSVSYWDSHIAASAILADCDVLASEDFQDGSLLRGVRVKNIFKPKP